MGGKEYPISLSARCECEFWPFDRKAQDFIKSFLDKRPCLGTIWRKGLPKANGKIPECRAPASTPESVWFPALKTRSMLNASNAARFSTPMNSATWRSKRRYLPRRMRIRTAEWVYGPFGFSCRSRRPVRNPIGEEEQRTSAPRVRNPALRSSPGRCAARRPRHSESRRPL
jgi:hypothetical protein